MSRLKQIIRLISIGIAILLVTFFIVAMWPEILYGLAGVTIAALIIWAWEEVV